MTFSQLWENRQTNRDIEVKRAKEAYDQSIIAAFVKRLTEGEHGIGDGDMCLRCREHTPFYEFEPDEIDPNPCCDWAEPNDNCPIRKEAQS